MQNGTPRDADVPASGTTPHLVRTALFVDFDNIYLGLERQSYEAARQFATNPQRWMDWLRRQPIESDPAYENFYRRFLVRRCYLNPNSFSRFRADFTRSAFHVVDCPPLTSGGKTSADIHMVLDILDTLQQETRVDEFMILSADADFTPVLSRLSRHDRRSVVLAVGPASATYRAACDLLLDQDEFIDELLPDRDEPQPNAPPAAAGPGVARAYGNSDELLRAMADRVLEAAVNNGDVQARELPGLYRSFPEFARSTDWLGHFGLRRLTDHVVSLRPDLAIEEPPNNPNLWQVVVRRGTSAGEVAAPAAVPAPAMVPAPAAVPAPMPQARPAAARVAADVPDNAPVDVPPVAADIAAFLSTMLAGAPRPVAVAMAASRVKQRFGSATVGNWLGFGRFEEMLRRLPPGTFAVSDNHPRYLYDPARHAVPGAGEERSDEMADKHPELMRLAWRIHQITEVPYLTPERFAAVFDEIAREVGTLGYDVIHTSRVVRDRLVEAGEPVPRVAITFVLRGLAYVQPDFGRQPHSAEALAAAFRDNVLAMCRNARLELSEEEKGLLNQWLVGGAGPAGAEPSPAETEA